MEVGPNFPNVLFLKYSRFSGISDYPRFFRISRFLFNINAFPEFPTTPEIFKFLVFLNIDVFPELMKTQGKPAETQVISQAMCKNDYFSIQFFIPDVQTQSIFYIVLDLKAASHIQIEIRYGR